MPTSMQSDTLWIPPEAEALPNETPSSRCSQPAFQPIALSSRARERLRVLNQVLEACAPPSLIEHEPALEVTVLQ